MGLERWNDNEYTRSLSTITVIANAESPMKAGVALCIDAWEGASGWGTRLLVDPCKDAGLDFIDESFIALLLGSGGHSFFWLLVFLSCGGLCYCRTKKPECWEDTTTMLQEKASGCFGRCQGM